MDSNFKYIKLETGEEFYIICDVYDQTELGEFLSTRKSLPVIDIGCTYYKDTNTYCVPKWLEFDAEQYYNGVYSNTVNTLATFNFMLNKPNTHRFMLLKLLESMSLHTDYYTYSGVRGFNEFGTTSIKPKFYTDENTVVTDQFVTTSGDTSPAYNRTNYDRFLKSMFESTAVSLITESVVNENQIVNTKSIHFSEKTLFSVLGLTFPIWVGGYGQADAWKNLGFDTFENVIDHSYQYKETLEERCYCALNDNKHILENLSYASLQRSLFADRLLANRDLLLSKHITQCVNNSVQTIKDPNIQAYIQDMRTVWFPTFDSKQ